LADLINLGLASLTLKIDQLADTRPPEDVMATSSTLLKPQPEEQAAEVFKIDVRVGFAL
jgi:hypothetical protein